MGSLFGYLICYPSTEGLVSVPELILSEHLYKSIPIPVYAALQSFTSFKWIHHFVIIKSSILSVEIPLRQSNCVFQRILWQKMHLKNLQICVYQKREMFESLRSLARTVDYKLEDQEEAGSGSAGHQSATVLCAPTYWILYSAEGNTSALFCEHVLF